MKDKKKKDKKKKDKKKKDKKKKYVDMLTLIVFITIMACSVGMTSIICWKIIDGPYKVLKIIGSNLLVLFIPVTMFVTDKDR